MARPIRWNCLLLLLAAFSAVGDWRSDLPGAQRIGSGEFTWFGLSLYTAQLWAAGPVHDWNQPFALDLLYHRALSKDTLVKASLQEMRRLSAGTLTAQQSDEWGKALGQAFADVEPGMRITGVYIPEVGCRFYINGQLSREIADPYFARAFFAIWLAPGARDTQLRQRLLGLAGNERGT